MKPLTILQQHVAKWRDCTNCNLCQSRSKVVFTRGTIPCEVLFVGEAPGFSEDVLGQPFVGPAGALLNKIITRALAPDGMLTRSVAFTNLICCIPKDENAQKVTEPDHDNIMACQERLEEFVNICRPKLLVQVGKQAKDYFDQSYKHALKVPKCVSMTHIVHPAYILRSNFANREIHTQRCVVTIASAAEVLDDLPEWGPDDRCSRYIPKQRGSGFLRDDSFYDTPPTGAYGDDVPF